MIGSAKFSVSADALYLNKQSVDLVTDEQHDAGNSAMFFTIHRSNLHLQACQHSQQTALCFQIRVRTSFTQFATCGGYTAACKPSGSLTVSKVKVLYLTAKGICHIMGTKNC